MICDICDICDIIGPAAALAAEAPGVMSRQVRLLLLAGVRSGGRPNEALQAPVSVRELIRKCWAQDAADRPVFMDICATLATALEAAA